MNRSKKIFEAIKNNPGITSMELRQQFGETSSYITAILVPAIKKGLVKRIESPKRNKYNRKLWAYYSIDYQVEQQQQIASNQTKVTIEDLMNYIIRLNNRMQDYKELEQVLKDLRQENNRLKTRVDELTHMLEAERSKNRQVNDFQKLMRY